MNSFFKALNHYLSTFCEFNACAFDMNSSRARVEVKVQRQAFRLRVECATAAARQEAEDEFVALRELQLRQPDTAEGNRRHRAIVHLAEYQARLNSYRNGDADNGDDADAIRSDWLRVNSDLAAVINEYQKEDQRLNSKELSHAS